MAAPRPGVDLEKELTCSICTEVLYQPLTLLDCLHTFCGSCLKDWFSWQATAAERSPNPPAAGASVATCPSCRATVRDTRHNATVATLLDMFLSANPDKARPDAEKDEMLRVYKPGDDVLPKVVRQPRERSAEERRIEELERQMLDRARELSLRDAGIGGEVVAGPSHASRQHRQDDRGVRRREGSDTDTSRDSRQHRGSRDRSRRPARGEEDRRRHESSGRLQPEGTSSGGERRLRHSESQQRSRDASRSQRRAIEHQASIRSLISSSDVDSRDMEREIEEFAAQIQEEGLLDGLDLDNIDLDSNDELTRKITEAYRRRQQQRSRHENSRRSPLVPHSSHRADAESPPTGSRQPPISADSSRPTGRQRDHSAQPHTRSSSTTGHMEDRTRPPISSSSHLEVHAGPERRRRRTSSGARSATDPVRPRTVETRPTSRSQTDLTLRSQTSDPTARRPSFSDSRSSSMPTTTTTTTTTTASSVGRPFSERASAAAAASQNAQPGPAIAISSERSRARPQSLVVSPTNPLPSLGLPQSTPSQQQRTRSQFYQEPSITCSKCARAHIEYELHYNCSKCNGGNWNICLDCYRRGKGCLHWFGFGHAAVNKWERAHAGGDEHLEPPHVLTAHRYTAPKAVPGGADGRRTMTTDDPASRLQSGMLCARCLAWANDCCWRCDVCNEGDWGFCNNCVNQGRCCTHALLPVTFVAPPTQQQQPSAAILQNNNSNITTSPPPSPGSMSIGGSSFQPMTFKTTCDVCRTAIPPTAKRFHCYACNSSVVDTQPGDYDVCTECYTRLPISPENGAAGWRRCLKGHRMAVIEFQESRRCVVQDLVGGWDLRVEDFDHVSLNGGSASSSNGDNTSKLQKWWWYDLPSSSPQQREKLERLVTRDVRDTAPPPPTPPLQLPSSDPQQTPASSWTETFPPDGGTGTRATARWAWYPRAGVDNELLFPKGAEVVEVEDVNGDWFFGYYMGAEGLFPAPYVWVGGGGET